MGELWPQYEENILKLKLSDVHNGERYCTGEEIAANTGLTISMQKVRGLRGIYDTALTRYGKNDQNKKKRL